MKVLKFGGTSVGTVRSLENVKKIVEGIDGRAIVVVSALGGLTDRLIASAEMARRHDCGYEAELETMTRRHHEIIDALVPPSCRDDVKARIDTLLAELHRIYDGVAMLGELTERTLDSIVSFGERMSSIVVANIINGARHYNSPDFIKTEKWFNKNIADTDLTTDLIRRTFADGDFSIAVTGGFISTDRDSGEITNLGRGGSDYTAALIAAALDAEVLEIWTDVDGFMTADPRLIPQARVVDHMTFIESMELCTMGAKVIYPPTIYPVFHKNIPIRILNTFNPEAEGTWVTDNSRPDDMAVKGISSIRNTTLIRVDGASPAEVDGEDINSRTYNAMTKNGVNVYLVNSLDSNAFTFAVNAADSGNAVKILTEEFSPELSRGELENISATYRLATIAVVGEKMHTRPLLLSQLVSLLAGAGIKIHATSDGSSDTTISLVVGADRSDEAIRLIHDRIYCDNAGAFSR